MKKSEFKWMLAGFLSTIYETYKHPEEQVERANLILNFLEEMGMRPPFNHDLYTKTWHDGGMMHCWEEE
jgi:hypothetical protein